MRPVLDCHVAQTEGLAGEPGIASGGPRERFSSPRSSAFRLVAVGLIAVLLAALGGYRWGTTHAGSRQAIVPRDVGEVIAILGGRPSGEGFGAGSIWDFVWSTSDRSGYVARYDPATRRMLARIVVGRQPLAAQPGFGSMWVTNAGDGTVTRIDPSHNAVLKTIKVGPAPYQIAPAGGGMWVATQNAAVKIDPTTDRVIRRTPYPRSPYPRRPVKPGSPSTPTRTVSGSAPLPGRS